MYIHRDLVASVSKPLGCLTNGKMSEARNGEAVLEDVDKLTFARFCQWVYEGYYDAEVHRDRPKDTAIAEKTGIWNFFAWKLPRKHLQSLLINRR